MQKMIKNICCILISCSLLFAQQSETMGRIAGFMPTVTESAGLASAVNVYMKIADWVRATNTVVRSMRGAVQDIRNAKRAVESIITTAKEMRNISLYCMDTWATTVDNAKMIVGPHTSSILRSMGAFEMHAVGGVRDYMKALNELSEFEIREEKNKRRRLINREFSPQDDLSHLADVFANLREGEERIRQIDIEIALLEIERDEIQAKLSRSNLPEERRQLNEELRLTNRRITRLERKKVIQRNIADGVTHTVRTDSIVIDAREIMAANLMEVERIFFMVRRFEEQAKDLMTDISRLTNNNAPSRPRQSHSSVAMNEPVGIESLKREDGRSIFGNCPNQAPIPVQSTNSQSYRFGNKDRAEVNTHDIIQLRNQINLVLLRQEMHLRDIAAMKTNSLAYILLIDGSNRGSNLAAYDALKVFSHRLSEKTK